MRSGENYEAKKAAKEARDERKRDAAQQKEHQAALSKLWFWEHTDRNVKYAGWLSIYTFALFVATLLLFAATLISAGILNNTDETIRNQLELMRITQRPWLDFSSVNINDQAIFFAKEDISIGVKFRLKNTGHLPAMMSNVNFGAKPLVISNIDIGDVIRDMQVDICRGAEHQTGNTIFPGENSVEHNATFKEARSTFEKTQFDSILVSSCVGYSTSDIGTYGHTGVSILVSFNISEPMHLGVDEVIGRDLLRVVRLPLQIAD
jgi:hypothetical protein